ncbi:hypothetical protein [Streptomyces sp. NPDC094468]|uniref:hypothetical protein n=1 Tax=Streptomyces sp. NPDC094468 TaxID=3366066 RepID=UPI003801484F
MPEPLSDDYLRRTQEIIASVPKGPWEPIPSDFGAPDGVGPISYLETASEDYQAPVVQLVSHAREALPRYVGEVARQRDRIRDLERQLRVARQGGTR